MNPDGEILTTKRRRLPHQTGALPKRRWTLLLNAFQNGGGHQSGHRMLVQCRVFAFNAAVILFEGLGLPCW